jgi:hypothetical protein
MSDQTDQQTTDVQPAASADTTQSGTATATQDEQTQSTQTDQTQQQQTATAPATQTAPAESATQTTDETAAEEDESFNQYQPNIPDVQPLDLSKLPVNDENLIDPNALAGAINQQIASAEQRAVARAQQGFNEQRAEDQAWNRAYEKYPQLRSDKELRALVHQARLGEVTDMLSRSQDPRSVKLPTPSQIAGKLFKYMGTAKQEGMQQATTNTVIQQSARLETGGTRTNDNADTKAKNFQNINNPNREVAKKARTDLLKSMLFGDS